MRQLQTAVVLMVVVGMSVAVHAQQATPAAQHVDYETFFKLDVQSRIRVFNEVTAENRAELVKTQIQRWLDQNRARLTPEQVKLLEEAVTLTVADNYKGPMNDELRTKMQSLEKRMGAAFSQEDLRDAITINGPYIPKKIK